MPLLFALAGIAALGLSVMVLIGPVLAVTALVRVIRMRRRTPPAQHQDMAPEEDCSLVDSRVTDAAFIELVSRQWPDKAVRLPLEQG